MCTTLVVRRSRKLGRFQASEDTLQVLFWKIHCFKVSRIYHMIFLRHGDIYYMCIACVTCLEYFLRRLLAHSLVTGNPRAWVTDEYAFMYALKPRAWAYNSLPCSQAYVTKLRSLTTGRAGLHALCNTCVTSKVYTTLQFRY